MNAQSATPGILWKSRQTPNQQNPKNRRPLRPETGRIQLRFFPSGKENFAINRFNDLDKLRAQNWSRQLQEAFQKTEISLFQPMWNLILSPVDFEC